MVRVLFSASWSAILLICGLAILYVAVPLSIDYFVARDRYLITLATATAVAIASIATGFRIPWLDRRFDHQSKRLRVSSKQLQLAVWLSFLVFVFVVLFTAKTIPLFSAIRGSPTEELSVERGDFLKARDGWEAILPYLSTIYVGALLPYATARMFVERHAWRFAAFILFAVYTLLSLEKVLFIFALVPVAYIAVQREDYRSFIGLLVFATGILYLNVILERGIGGATPVAQQSAKQKLAKQKLAKKVQQPQGPYFTSRYRPRSALDHIVWRSISVPVFTAADAFRVFDYKFGGEHFLGATSSLVAKVTGQRRVNYDAEVFGHQYGMSEIGRANSVYLTEAYVNFGWFGIILFSLFVGQALRWFDKSSDDAFKAMWPLFCWLVFSAGLIGTLLSNGYVLVFAFALFCCVEPDEGGQRARSASP
jgi:hypothetical protein